MRAIRFFVAFCAVLWLGPAGAVENKTFKHDQFSEDLALAAAQVSTMALSAQPGYAQGEAFGQIYVPAATDYPVKILGIDLIMAAPPNMAGGSADAQFEVWLHDGTAADPGTAAPAFSVTTDELFNPVSGEFGFPLQGGVAYSLDFDWDEPDSHPPYIMAGNFRVVVRFSDPAQDLQTEWNTMQCMQMPGLGMCGCQEVGTLHDPATTSHANVMHIYSGSCGGSLIWRYTEAVGVTGDYILRVRAEVAGGGCTADCNGRECGDDGCGGSCGLCAGSETCTPAGQCEPACQPDCTGKECGDDGCGGQCGSCSLGETCSVMGLCEPDCVPDCTGRECGDDGCGGSCGTCPAAAPNCQDGLCTTVCTPDCAGKECGDNGCGGSCGTCPAAAPVCDAAGTCHPACEPDCLGKACGADGCGGSCGECPAEAPNCVDGQCQFACVADCAEKQCGDDGCGGSCGECPAEAPNCEAGLCVAGCTPVCTGKECGDDGCGGTCGGCPAAAPNCEAGQCVAGCTPACAGKECGDDGCGGSCGTCPAAAPTCEAGLCVGGCTPNCTGRECGDDGCGGTCGECPAAAPVCQAGLCEAEACQPDCAGKECGDDGCGGSCGSCSGDGQCDTGVCIGPDAINPERKSSGGCGAAGPTAFGSLSGLFTLLGLALLRRRRAR